MPAEGVIADDGAYCLALSEDLTSAVVGYRKRTETLVYWNMGIYKLTTSSNDWYADTFGMASSLSLTGFATGATDEAGRYEFKTATKA